MRVTRWDANVLSRAAMVAMLALALAWLVTAATDEGGGGGGRRGAGATGVGDRVDGGHADPASRARRRRLGDRACGARAPDDRRPRAARAARSHVVACGARAHRHGDGFGGGGGMQCW